MDKTRWRVPVAVLLGMLVIGFTGALMKAVPWPDALRQVPHFGGYASYSLDLLAIIVLLRVVGGVSLAQQWAAVGLGRPWRPAALMVLCLFLPVIVLAFAFGQLSPDASVSSSLFRGIAAPLAEEVTFRGLATGILLMVAGWRFWPAALFPALIFGLLHASQGQGVQEIAGVVGVTAMGGLLFSWLYQRFGHNLWPPVVIHMGLNLIWDLFDLGHNALGGALGNGLRFAVIGGAIAFALWGRDWLARIAREAH